MSKNTGIFLYYAFIATLLLIVLIIVGGLILLFFHLINPKFLYVLEFLRAVLYLVLKIHG
jgi:hypothetical protein